MKRFYYNSSIAKILLAFSSCHTITIGPFVFSKRDSSKIGQNVKNHETCHSCQWLEITIVVGLVIFILQVLFGISPLWYILPGAAFYIWYGIEWFIKLLVYRDTEIAYYRVSFEQEAYYSEHDCHYIENRPLFGGWTQYIKI